MTFHMDTQLENDLKKQSAILQKTLEVANAYFEQQQALSPGKYVADLAPDELPDHGTGGLETLAFFEKNYAHLIANSAGPRYFGFVTGGSTPASIAGDWLVSAYDQNACGSNDSIAPQIEHQTIDYFKQLFGLHDDYYGSFVTGATMANFVGLALGRQWVGEQHGIDPSNEGLAGFPLRVVSGTPHSSAIKSLSMLGIGRHALHRIDTLPEREAVNLVEMEKFLAATKDQVIVIANAGTVNTVDFDDLHAIGALKQKYNFWLHVDAAFGGFAACSPKYSHLLRGINFADSITIDAHKWLNVPYDAAMQFTRHKMLQLKVFQNNASYLTDPEKSADFFHYTPESSRRWRALPSWFTLRAYGRSGYREIVERNCLLADALGERIAHSDSFALLSRVRMNVVCFTVTHPDVSPDLIQSFLNAVRDEGNVFFTPTSYKGKPAIRAAVSNWLTDIKDIEIAFEVISNVWDRIKAMSVPGTPT